MKKALCTGFGVAATIFVAIGFIFLPPLISLAIVKYFNISGQMKTILLLVSFFEGIFVNFGILMYFADKMDEKRKKDTDPWKEDKASPWIIVEWALAPIALLGFSILVIWPSMLLERLGFSEGIQLIGVLGWLFLLIVTVIAVVVYEPKEHEPKEKSKES